MVEKSPIPEAPSGRERLLETAVRLFSRDGFDGTSVRAVADEAGVAWSLVRFYFKSKEGLREATEKYVMSSYLARVRAASSVESFEELESVIETQTAGLPDIARFLRRAIAEERPLALEFIRNLMDEMDPLRAGDHRGAPDEPALRDPVHSLASRIGYLLIAPQVETLTGRDLFSVEEIKRRNAYAHRIEELVALGLEAERARKKI